MTKINDWEKWHYENNAPWTIISMSFLHALIFSIFCFFLNVINIIPKLKNISSLMSFVSLNFLCNILLCFLTSILFVFIHGLEYFIFKKWLLNKKIEQNVVIAWFLMSCHFIILLYLFEYLSNHYFKLLPAFDGATLAAAYMIGLIGSLVKFQLHFYKKPHLVDKNKNLWKNFLPENQHYFEK